jgi:hypothetical protein
VKPNLFLTVATGLIVLISVLAVLPSRGSDQSSADEAGVTPDALASRASESDVHVPDEVPPGYYPPAPSKAIGMTPEWREFADTVDRICALSFNYALVDAAKTEQLARERGWSIPAAESVVVRIWGEQTGRIVKATARLGNPPAEQALYQRWRANVGHRSDLFFSASAAARRSQPEREGRILAQIHRLKGRSDKLGQRFGLRICTSN